ANSLLVLPRRRRSNRLFKPAFGSPGLIKIAEPTGKIGHAELQIGEVILMMSDEYPDYDAVSAETLGGSPIKLHLYVPDVDLFAQRAVAAGAIVSRPIEDQSYGDRAGQLKDPFGYTWMVATHKQDVSVADMQKGFDDYLTERELPKKFKR